MGEHPTKKRDKLQYRQKQRMEKDSAASALSGAAAADLSYLLNKRDPHRFDLVEQNDGQQRVKTMKAVVTTGNGGAALMLGGRF